MAQIPKGATEIATTIATRIRNHGGLGGATTIATTIRWVFAGYLSPSGAWETEPVLSELP